MANAADDEATRRVDRILAGLDAADLELMSPPPTVWSGIEERLAAGRCKTPPAAAATTPATVVVEYRIDAADRVVEVGPAWSAFAEANDAPELAAGPLGRLLWDGMDGDEVRGLWEAVVRRVRADGRPARVPFRCDGVDHRRWFEMTLTPEVDGGVGFRSVLVFEEPRAAVALLDPERVVDGAAPPVALCSWCGRGRHGDEWIALEDLVARERLLERDPMPALAHGICAPCRADMAADAVVGAAGAD